MLESKLPRERSQTTGGDQPQARPSDLFEALAGVWGGGGTLNPAVDVSQTDQDVLVEAELPGLAPGDVQIDLTEDILTIKGEKKQERQERGDAYERTERSYGAFFRALPLPAKVVSDQAQARFENGVLKIRLPKAQPGPAKQATRIVIE